MSNTPSKEIQEKAKHTLKSMMNLAAEASISQFDAPY